MSTLIRISLFALFLTAYHLPLQSQSLTDSLVLHYKLNGTAIDETNNSLDGTVNNVGFTADRFGNPSNAGSFNGSTSYISIPASSLLKTSFPFSISAWVKINQLPTQGAYPIFANDESPTQSSYHGAWISILQSGRVQANYGNGGSASSQFRYTRESITSLSAGQWYMVTAVYNSTADIDIYIDCSPSQGNVSGNSSISMQYSNAAGAAGRRIGNVNGGQPTSIHYFNGSIDQIRFWNRSLTQTDITALCNEVDDSEPDTCIAAFTFNQAGFDADFFDASQYNGTGTLTYNWAFGDGISSSVQSPIHTYGASGSYNACLTISDGVFCNDTKCDSLTVVDSCKANFTYMTQGFSVDFQNTSLYYVPGGTPNYLWDFGDGNSSNVPNPTHTYGASGSYNTCLTINDGAFCNDTKCDSLTVADNCKANFTYMTQGFSVDFQNTSLYYVPGGTPNYLWDFGDGNSSSQPDPIYIYGASGTYTVCLTISDNQECSYQYCQDITITDSTNAVGVLDKGEIHIFPNPTEGTLFIDFNESKVTTIELYAITGEQLLVRQSQSQIEEVNLSSLAEGIYLLKVGNKTHRIVKQ